MPRHRHRPVVAVVLMLTAVCAAAPAEPIFPGQTWPAAKPADVGMDAKLLEKARDYALSGGGSGYITRHGRLVMSWGDPARLYDLKSSTKSFGATALAVAVMDGKIKLDAKARTYHPTLGAPPEANAKTGWLDKITIFNLATQTAGFEKPGGYTKLLFEPGTKWDYSDSGPNWLAECITLQYKRDLNDLMFDRVFTPIGITPKDLRWRNNAYRPHTIEGVARREFGSGISANVNAMARLGYLYLRGGQWNGKRIIPSQFIDQARTAVPGVKGLPERNAKDYGNASDHYGYLWWNNADGTLAAVPRDAYWSWGLYDSIILVIPSLDIVASRAGKSWSRKGWSGHYGVLTPYFEPIVKSVQQQASAPFLPLGEGRGEGSAPKTYAVLTSASRAGASCESVSQCADACLEDPTEARTARPTLTRLALQATGSQGDRGLKHAPYPPSPVITALAWAPRDTIVRRARGSDNWPVTWGDDDQLYTAYGDGRGFEPFVPRKLSMGLARVEGPADAFKGVNIRSPDAEQAGDGASGKKASGMLMVDGVLYMWARNAANAQLAWSRDHGGTWTWADWRWTTSFGFPVFLNTGRDGGGAPDEYVYVYSFDNDSAYVPADRMVLARVPRDHITRRDAYAFFVGVDDAGRPQWSPDIARRAAVFKHKGRCYRNGITYNAALKRYLWCQVFSPRTDGKRDDTRFEGGLGVYDAPQPWGPWTTVYFTEKWDVGPGECASFPAKWISADGRTLHLVFSGDDHFSVRRATLTLAGDARP